MQKLSPKIVQRIKVYKNKLAEVDKIPFGITVHNFSRDTNPLHELRRWETLTSSLLKAFRKGLYPTMESRKEAYYRLVVLLWGSLKEDSRENARYIFKEKHSLIQLAIQELDDKTV